MRKIPVYSLVGLFILSCSVSAPDNSSPLAGRIQYAPTDHSSLVRDTSSPSLVTRHPSLNFSDMEKEYKTFSTKALSDAYVSRMFTKFLVTTPNPTQIIRQLEFARYLKDIKSDSSYFNSLTGIISNDSTIYTKINTMPEIVSYKTANPATFGTFVNDLSPILVCGTGSTAGMVSYWSFDNATISGTTLDDTYGSNNGTLMGKAGQTDQTGVVGQSFFFNGNGDDYVNVGNDSSLNILGPITIEAWINYASNGNDAIFSKTDGTGSTDNPYDYRIQSGTNKTFLVRANTGTSIYMPDITLIPLNTWHYVAVTHNLTTVKHYVDGVLSLSETKIITPTGNSKPALIGARDGGATPFNGYIDELAVYNRALSESEILEHYNKSLAGKAYCK